MFDLEKTIIEWRRQMAAGGIKSPELLDELESHLRDDVARQVRIGSGGQQAFEAAVQRIGTPHVLQSEFVKIGLLVSQKMVRFRPCMIAINLILGALLTTPEVWTQILMFIPLQLLYEASIWIARHRERNAKKRAMN